MRNSLSGGFSERRNIVVMTDEAHWGQYGFKETIDESGKVSVGMVRINRELLDMAKTIAAENTVDELGLTQEENQGYEIRYCHQCVEVIRQINYIREIWQAR